MKNVVNLAAYRAERRAKTMTSMDPLAPWFAMFGVTLVCFSAPIALGAKLMLDTAERSIEIAMNSASRS